MKKIIRVLILFSFISCYVTIFAAKDWDLPFSDNTLTTWIGAKKTITHPDGSTSSTCIDNNQWRCVSGYVHS